MPFKKSNVVVPIDFTDESVEALDTALQLVDTPTQIHVLHVLPVLTATEPGIIWDTIDHQSRVDHAKEALAKRLDDPRYAGVDFSVAIGDPGEEIAEFAQERTADLIVLPSHGRTGIAHLLIGSTAERVVRMAHCPVLVLRK